jgi:hypothetical protein
VTADAQIQVTDGVHTGASVVLQPGRLLQIGSSSEADLMVIDEGVHARHLSGQLQDARLALTAHRAGVAVFGRSLAPGRRVLLRRGAWFSAGPVKFRFSGRDAPTTTMARDAERAYLLRHAPLAYVARRWSDAAPILRACVVATPCALALLPWFASNHLVDPPRSSRTSETFRLVKTHVDPKSGALVYEGYVRTQTDLAALSASAWSRQRAPVMRVIVLDQLQDAVREFLTRYYRGAEVRAAEPGAFSVTLPDGRGFVSPESWDYGRVERLARGEINGLRGLAFPGHAPGAGRVRVPLDALGMNLLVGKHALWLTDAQGTRYFVGARLPVGRITGISACAAEVTRDDDGSVYEFFMEASHAPRNCR